MVFDRPRRIVDSFLPKEAMMAIPTIRSHISSARDVLLPVGAADVSRADLPSSRQNNDGLMTAGTTLDVRSFAGDKVFQEPFRHEARAAGAPSSRGGRRHMPSDPKVPPAKLVRAVERLRHHLYRLHQRLVPAPIAMIELILGTWTSQAIQTAAALNIADALAGRPLQLDELSNRVGADPDALSRLMRALISRGIFRQHRDGRYGLTPLADTLRSHAPVSMSPAALFYGSKKHREHWSLLLESVKSGNTSVPLLRGKEFFDYLDDDPEFAKLFNDAMTSIAELAEAFIIAAYDFSPYSTVVDVGGGHGRLLAGILTATPTANGVLYDLPQVVAEAPALLRQRGVEERVRIEGGSFFDSVPAGGDAYIMKHVVHDWPDEQAIEILGRVRAAADKTDATVLLVETVIPMHDRDFIGKWADLEMLLSVPGRERTAEEYRKLLHQAGLRMTRVVQTASPISVVEARRA
jgi:C-methyltransferase